MATAALPRTFLTLHLVYAGGSDGAAAAVRALHSHYRDGEFDAVGGIGVDVRVWDLRSGVDLASLPLHQTRASMVCVLCDHALAADQAQVDAVRKLSARIAPISPRSVLMPVFVDDVIQMMQLSDNGIRAFSYEADPEHWLIRLRGDIANQVCRILRVLSQSDPTVKPLRTYLQNLRVFLSHSKRDQDGFGESVALAFRNRLHETIGPDTFFDINDIPPGARFEQVIEEEASNCAVLAIHSDSYSSREWCRREVIAAKTAMTPIVVAHCVRRMDSRTFAYLGNVPTARLGRGVERKWVDLIVTLVVEEAMKHAFWKIWVEQVPSDSGTVFLPRPPELFDLSRPDGAAVRKLVYPDPPLREHEQELFERVAPGVALRSMTQNAAGL